MEAAGEAAIGELVAEIEGLTETSVQERAWDQLVAAEWQGRAAITEEWAAVLGSMALRGLLQGHG